MIFPAECKRRCAMTNTITHTAYREIGTVGYETTFMEEYGRRFRYG